MKLNWKAGILGIAVILIAAVIGGIIFRGGELSSCSKDIRLYHIYAGTAIGIVIGYVYGQSRKSKTSKK